MVLSTFALHLFPPGCAVDPIGWPPVRRQHGSGLRQGEPLAIGDDRAERSGTDELLVI